MGKIKKENKNYELYLGLSQLNYICNFHNFQMVLKFLSLHFRLFKGAVSRKGRQLK